MGEQISDQAGTVARTIQIEQEIPIGAPPDQVYDAMTTRVDEWWDTGYRLLENSTIEMETYVGGRLLERAGKREAMWATITGFEPGKYLELTGRMAMQGAVIGVVTFELVPNEGTTLVRLSHHAAGDVDESTQSNYNGGWQYLLGTRLLELLESS